MAFTLNRRLSTLVNSSGQLNTGKIPNDYISTDHIANNVVTTAMLHSGFTVSSGHLGSIDSDAVSEGSSNLYFTNARVDSRLSGGTGVTYSSGAISIGQAVATSSNVTFANLTVTGDLTITGDINSYNVTDLDVADKTITVGAGQTESNSGGSGLIVDGASASILWDETNDQFDFNKGINVDSNTLVVDGTNNRVGILNASPDVSLDLGSATDGIHMPVGTTGQRPSSPAAGYFRYNSTDGQFEGYTTEWGAIAGSGGASAMETNNFTGDGSTTAFTLSSTVASEDNLIVFIEGIYQNKGDYVASGTTLTFTTAPVNSRRIVVQHVISSISGTNTILDSFNANGSTTAFTLSLAPGSENNTQIFIDGVYQQKTDYTVSGTTLTFDTAPANGAIIEVMIFTQTTVNSPAANTVGVTELNVSDGSNGQALTTNGSGTLSFASVGVSGISSSADATAITIDSSENVGIGTTSPDRLLDVSGTGNVYGKFQSTNATGAGIEVKDTSEDWLIQADGGTVDGLAFYDLGRSAYRMVIDDGGKVGIGTTSPAVSLDVSSKTDAIRVPNGTTAQQPTAATGMMRYNTTNSKLEGYVGSSWVNIKTSPQDLTQINGLEVWADVTGGISSTTVADLSGNNRTGTLASTSAKGTLSGNTYFEAMGSNYIEYPISGLPNSPWSGSNACTYFFVCTNKKTNNTYATYIGQVQNSVSYQIIRHNGASTNYNVYAENLSNWQITATNAVPVNATISEAYILIFQFKAPSGNSQVEIFKHENGSTTSATHAVSGNTFSFEWTDNGSITRVGTSAWSNEYLNAGIFAWGFTNTEMSSADRQIIYDYYADKGLAN